MELIYHTHEEYCGTNHYRLEYCYWDKEYYLCTTEEEYKSKVDEYKSRYEIDKGYYAANKLEDCVPSLSEEKKICVDDYERKWQGKSFTAVGFAYQKRYKNGSKTTYILKSDSVEGLKPSHTIIIDNIKYIV